MTALACDRYFIHFYICLVSACSHHVSGSSIKSTGCSYRCQNIFVYFSHSLKTGMLSSLVKKKNPPKKNDTYWGCLCLCLFLNLAHQWEATGSYHMHALVFHSYNPKRITKLCCAEKVFYYFKCDRWLMN